jgi:hypothetical protein
MQRPALMSARPSWLVLMMLYRFRKIHSLSLRQYERANADSRAPHPPRTLVQLHMLQLNPR